MGISNIHDFYRTIPIAFILPISITTLISIAITIDELKNKLRNDPKAQSPIRPLLFTIVTIWIICSIINWNNEAKEKPNAGNSKTTTIKNTIIRVTDAYINDTNGNKIKNKNPKSPVYLMKTRSESGTYALFGTYKSYNVYQFVIKDKLGVPNTVETTQNSNIIKIEYDVTNGDPYYEQTTCVWTKRVNQLLSGPCNKTAYIIHLKKDSQNTSIGSQLLTNTPSNISESIDPGRY